MAVDAGKDKGHKQLFSRYIVCSTILICVLAWPLAAVSSEGDDIWESIYTPKYQQFKYLDIFPLTSYNFSRCVFQSYDPWIVLLQRGTIGAEWKKTAAGLRGVVWFGMVDFLKEKDFLKELKFEISASEDDEVINVARVYPFGKRSLKQNKYHDVISPHAALSLAVQSLPSDSVVLLEDDEGLNEFLMNCLLTSPSRFPVVILNDPDQPFPPAFISLAIRLKRYFSFGRLDTSAASLLEELDLDKLKLQSTALVVLAGSMVNGNIKYNAIPYKMPPRDDTEDNDGVNQALSYPKLLQFFYNVNSRFRADLPADNLAEDEEVMTMEDVLEEEKKRFQILRNSRSPTLPKAGRHAGQGVTIDIQPGKKIEL